MLRNKYVKLIIVIALAILVVYTGITFTCTLTKAITQPHLEASGVRFDFLGFYMLSSTYGAICLVGIIILAVLSVLFYKKKV